LDERSLEGFLGFSDDDLAANRAGGLSSSQYSRLRSSGAWRLVVGPPVLVVAAVLAFEIGFALFAIFALVAAGFGLYLTWRGFAFTTDAHQGEVAYLTGMMSRRMVRGRYGPTYWAAVGPVSRRITWIAYNSLPEAMSCHLYYAPGCRDLLSVEPASAEEPKPDHPFGPDSAHAWDRLRWSWVLLTIGALGVLIGAHTVAIAHPAHPIRVGGTISNYVETHGKSTSRSLYLDNDPQSYTPDEEDLYSPPVPAFGSLIGSEVVLYVDEGTRNVIALDTGDQLYAGDWYLHPEHETALDAANGAVTAGASVIAIIVGIGFIVFGRRRAAEADGQDSSAPPLYAPPSVRPIGALWFAALLIAVMVAGVFLALGFAARA
jgi:hypothetical protein